MIGNKTICSRGGVSRRMMTTFSVMKYELSIELTDDV